MKNNIDPKIRRRFPQYYILPNQDVWASWVRWQTQDRIEISIGRIDRAIYLEVNSEQGNGVG